MKKKDLEVGKTYLWVENTRTAPRIVTVWAFGSEGARKATPSLVRAGYEKASYTSSVGEQAVLVTYTEKGRGGSPRKTYNRVTLGSLKEPITEEEFAVRQETARLERIAKEEARAARMSELEELADALEAKLGHRHFRVSTYPQLRLVAEYEIEELAQKILAF